MQRVARQSLTLAARRPAVSVAARSFRATPLAAASSHFQLADDVRARFPTKTQEIARETGIPENLVESPALHVLMLRTRRLFDMLGVPESQETEFLDSVNVSPGFATMEWAWPSPMPWHTNMEMALIKKPVGGRAASTH